MNRLPRLNLVSGHDDRELDLIRGTLVMFEVVAGCDALAMVLHVLAERGARAEVLDFVGHSRFPGFLALGSWVIDDSPQTAASFGYVLRPLFDRLGIEQIRLLGCSTAASEPARGAMQRIARATGREVFGSRTNLSSRDYGPDGFISDHALVSSSVIARERGCAISLGHAAQAEIE